MGYWQFCKNFIAKHIFDCLKMFSNSKLSSLNKLDSTIKSIMHKRFHIILIFTCFQSLLLKASDNKGSFLFSSKFFLVSTQFHLVKSRSKIQMN